MYLVTGGAGFIGSHLVEALCQRGEKVRVLDNLATGKKENLEDAAGHELPRLAPPGGPLKIYPLGPQAEFYYGDLTDLETCRAACRGVNYVFHQAALGSVQRSVEDPIASHSANATGTLQVLQAARENGVRRFLYASSSSVYGNAPAGLEAAPKEEAMPPNPQSPYAASKLAGEYYCRIFYGLYGFETVALRYFNVFGPRQDPQSLYSAVIPKFISALQSGTPPVIFGDGGQSRDFTFVGNVVEANLSAMAAAGAAGGVFNVACGRETSVNALYGVLQEIAGRTLPARYGQPRGGEVRHSRASIALARARFAYTVRTELEEGLAATWTWFQRRKA